MDEKQRFDAIAELWKDAWKRTVERRDIQWRVSFTLWAALASLCFWVLTDKVPFSGSGKSMPATIGVGAIGLSLVLVHLYWQCGLGRRHSLDRKMAIHYEKLLQSLSASCFPQELEDELKQIQRLQERTLDWSRFAQVAVTVILWVSTIGAVLVRMYTPR